LSLTPRISPHRPTWFFALHLLRPRSTLFPHTPLFRSEVCRSSSRMMFRSSKVPATAHPLEERNIMREDERQPSLPAEAALRNAPDRTSTGLNSRQGSSPYGGVWLAKRTE